MIRVQCEYEKYSYEKIRIMSSSLFTFFANANLIPSSRRPPGRHGAPAEGTQNVVAPAAAKHQQQQHSRGSSQQQLYSFKDGTKKNLAVLMLLCHSSCCAVSQLAVVPHKKISFCSSAAAVRRVEGGPFLKQSLPLSAAVPAAAV